MKKIFLLVSLAMLGLCIIGCKQPIEPSPSTYTVTFNANGGTGTMASQTFTEDVAQTLSKNTFTRADYNFVGWATSIKGPAVYADKATYTATANITLYAQWTTLPTYTVTFNANGGSGTMATQIFISSTPQALSQNTFTRIGYAFAGWATSANGTVAYADKATYTATVNITLYAQWTALPSYTITFYANGGTGEMTPQTFIEGVAQSLTENGFTVPADKPAFSHWNTKNNGTGKTYADGEAISITQNTDLYAIWADYTPLKDFVIDEKGVITDYTGSDSVVHIPPSVTGIGEKVFYYNKNLKSVTIPDSVTSIGKYAFLFCTNLESVNLPNNLTSIEYGAFGQCHSLGAITIPRTVTFIGERAFIACIKMQSITVEDSNTYYESEDGVLYNKGKTKLIQYPASRQGVNFDIPNSVTSIGDNAFCNSTGLQSIAIPDSVIYILQGAFAGCSGLESISIPSSVTSIAAHAFNSCSSIESISIPRSVTSISDYVFHNCSNLSSITIPDSVTSIGNSVFTDCTNLKDISIPNSVTSIGAYAFNGCSGLDSINLSNTLTSIGVNAFIECSNLENIVIPDSVTSIGAYAFKGCTSLQSISIPNNVTSIGWNTFEDCSNLENITIPDSITSIQNKSFFGCDNLTTVYTNYTKNDDGSSGGVKQYPPYNNSTGWDRGSYISSSNKYTNDDFFKANWVPIPVTP